MSEIEKLYKNTNTYKNLCECAFKNLYDYCINYGQDGCTHPISEISNGCENCKLAEQNVKYYPPFTAGKQIELIKWLARKDYGIYAESLLISIRDGYNYLSVGITTDFGSECFYENSTFDNKQFDEAIAGLINNLWQDLSPEEQQQVKGILE